MMKKIRPSEKLIRLIKEMSDAFEKYEKALERFGEEFRKHFLTEREMKEEDAKKGGEK